MDSLIINQEFLNQLPQTTVISEGSPQIIFKDAWESGTRNLGKTTDSGALSVGSQYCQEITFCQNGDIRLVKATLQKAPDFTEISNKTFYFSYNINALEIDIYDYVRLVYLRVIEG